MANRFETNGNGGEDWPIHQPSSEYSSIGPSWPPEKSSHKRIKGFFPYLIDDYNTLQPFIEEFNRNNKNQKFGIEVTRISLRCLIKKDFLLDFPDELKPLIEVIIPLKETKDFDDYCLVYFGANHQLRGSKHSIEEDLNRFRQTLQREAKKPEEILKNVQDKGYDIRVLSNLEIDDPTINQIHQLIERFGYDLETTKEMLRDPNFTVGIALKDRKVVSVSLAEKSIQIIDNKPFVLVELTEASTDKEHLGNGLYTAVSTAMLIHLADKSRNGDLIHLVFGECNGAAQGVLNTARSQGRRFAYENVEIFGFSLGYLPKHVPILDPYESNISAEMGNYNNLFPAYLTRKVLEDNF